MRKQGKKLLSVVVPAYKERTIKKDLEDIEETLRNGLSKDYDYEIICVIDGSPDDTEKEAKKIKSRKIRILSYKENRGKGFAVRFGMKTARGDIIALMDAGRELHPNGLLMGMEHLNWYNADLIVGSKRHPASRVNYPPERRLMSMVYQLLVRFLFGLNVRDTQVGLKLLKKDVVKRALPLLAIDNYAFDIELLALASHLGFNRIYESPVEIHYNFSSITHASTAKSIFRMFIDTLGVFYRLKILGYYKTKD